MAPPVQRVSYAEPRRVPTPRITSKFRLPSRRSYIRSHGYPFRTEGGARDATEPAGVRGAAARTVPERHARRERGPAGRGRRRHRSPSQGGDPLAPAAGAGAPRPPAPRTPPPPRPPPCPGGGGLVGAHTSR